jgi:hypothetical protein
VWLSKLNAVARPTRDNCPSALGASGARRHLVRARCCLPSINSRKMIGVDCGLRNDEEDDLVNAVALDLNPDFRYGTR